MHSHEIPRAVWIQFFGDRDHRSLVNAICEKPVPQDVVNLRPTSFIIKISVMSDSSRDLVDRCQTVLAHAWMVRTFVKHSAEIEDFPELMGIVRGVFDLSRAVETRVDDPAEYFKMLDKKLPSLREAVEKFAIDAPLASTHTNFIQAVISIRASEQELAALCAQGLLQTTTIKAPPSITKPIPRRPSPPSSPLPDSTSTGSDN